MANSSGRYTLQSQRGFGPNIRACYVGSLPERMPNGKWNDWGWTEDASKAIPVGTYWERRFVSDMRACHRPCVIAVHHEPMPRFLETFCSHCGEAFGPGNSGYSHCDQHEGREANALPSSELIVALIGGDRVLEADGNANSDLRQARTAEFHVNREPVPERSVKVQLCARLRKDSAR